MRKHAAVAWLALGLAWPVSAATLQNAAKQRGGVPRFECGRYRLRGQLRTHGSATRAIAFFSGSTRQFLLPVRDLSIADRIGYANRSVELEVFIYHPGRGSEARARLLKAVHAVSEVKARREPVERLSSEHCQ